MMDVNEIDWVEEAPEWANAVVSSTCGTLYYVEKFGGISKRQQVGSTIADWNVADMEKPHNWTLVSERPSPWDGKDLPPLGTKCLYATRIDNNDFENLAWYECEVRYVVPHSGVVAYCHAYGGDLEQWLDIETTAFKPIPVKSKAEIAKEEAIASILKDVKSIWASSDKELAEALYELGYVKASK